MKKLSNDGFTLVELMVVVSIIGILSAVAIPNFKSYQAKSKTSEAKLQLASIYSAETALQSDYDSFGTCLGFAGYSAPKQGNYYALGFTGANATADANVDDAAGGTACVVNGALTDNSGHVVGADRNVATIGRSVVLASIIAGNISPNIADGINGKTGVGVGNAGDWFIVGAIGVINPSATSAINDADQWVIDENKSMQNVDSGVNL